MGTGVGDWLPMVSDTIVAISTSIGRAAIGVVRLSGPNSWNYALKHLKILPKERVAAYSKFTFEEKILDDVIAIFYKSPNTYTGEDMVEISFHGNPLVLSKAVRALTESGARLAERGEFTKRAFLNGKMDLIAAEAVEKLIDSTSDIGVEIARKTMSGALSKAIVRERMNLLNTSAQIEARIDYPDEFEDEFDLNISPVIERMERILSTYDPAMTAIEGVKVVLLGAPNVGKSSILNALVGKERAIVTAIPGTTRDTVEAEISVNGLKVKIVDTAGIRKTSDEVEKAGVARAIMAAKEAHIKVHILDATSEEKPIELPADIMVVNKSDLAKRQMKDALNVSAKTGYGIEELRERISNLAKRVAEDVDSNEAFIISERQYQLLHKCVLELKESKRAQKMGYPVDVVDINIRNAIEELDSLVGRKYSEDILDVIFSKFCVGK